MATSLEQWQKERQIDYRTHVCQLKKFVEDRSIILLYKWYIRGTVKTEIKINSKNQQQSIKARLGKQAGRAK